MSRAAWSVAAFAVMVSGPLISIGAIGAGAIGASTIGGCALTSPADTSPGIDPTLPDLDASWVGDPASGGGGGGGADASASTAADASTGKSTAPKSPDGGATIAPPDAGNAGPPRASVGDILISEVMYNPVGPEPRGEWFEIVSRATGARSLSGLTLVDSGGRTHVIGAGVVIDAGAYALLVRDRATAISLKVPSAAILYEYGTGLADNAGILLLNGATGKVSIVDGQTVITQAPYGGWFTQTGGSTVQLKDLDPTASTSQASWCLSATPWTTGSDKGTPGAACNCP
jgi:hypothetical protein